MIERAYHRNLVEIGTGSAPRFGAQLLAGFEIALWDLVGKALGQPVHRLFGGAVRAEIGYFGFLQGADPETLAADAARKVAAGFSVIYCKVGFGEERDVENLAAVRAAIGARRLRIDANGAWDLLTARRSIERLKPFNPELIEQPLPGAALDAIAEFRATTDLPVSLDESCFTVADVYQVCRRGLADLVTVGIHEACGILGVKKAAAIAEQAGRNICLHAFFETGVSTCATNQVGATIPNLDDGNQIMVQLLEEDIITAPSLKMTNGRLPVIETPGLGFELNPDAVDRAAERYAARHAI